MGTLRIPIELASLSGTQFDRLEASVDTGATYTSWPGDRLEYLGVRPEEEWPFVHQVAWARVRIGGRSQPTIVIFGDPGSEPLLGAFTLEGFLLAADPVNRRLVPVPGLLNPLVAA